MDQFAARASDTMRQTVFWGNQDVVEVKERRPHRRFVLPVAGLLAAVGVAAPLLLFAGSPADQPRESAAIAQVNPDAPATLAAAVDSRPAPVVIEIPPVATGQRTARIEQGASPETDLNEPEARMGALPDDDPRWARVETAAPGAGAKPDTVPETIETAELRSKLEQLQTPAPADRSAAAVPAVETRATDATFTGTIPPRPADDVVPPAEEPAEEIAAVVPAQEAPVEGIGPAVSIEEEEPAADDASAVPGRAAQIKTHVNVRSGPENEAAVLTVLPSGTSVNVIGGCEHWCEIDFDGKRGYVYKSFISGS